MGRLGVSSSDSLGCRTHGSEHVGGLAAVRSLADRDWERGSARAGNGVAMVQVWMQVQVHMQEWVWVWERPGDDVNVVVAADRGWGRVGVKAQARTRLRHGDAVVVVADEGVGPWGRPVGPPR